jgi:hypothetical protein
VPSSPAGVRPSPSSSPATYRAATSKPSVPGARPASSSLARNRMWTSMDAAVAESAAESGMLAAPPSAVPAGRSRSFRNTPPKHRRESRSLSWPPHHERSAWPHRAFRFRRRRARESHRS